jgi:hypothetical protein
VAASAPWLDEASAWGLLGLWGLLNAGLVAMVVWTLRTGDLAERSLDEVKFRKV